jgi:hypothetical protein
VPCSAPPAPAFERQLAGGSASEYAAAALAGLPADDDAVQGGGERGSRGGGVGRRGGVRCGLVRCEDVAWDGVDWCEGSGSVLALKTRACWQWWGVSFPFLRVAGPGAAAGRRARACARACARLPHVCIERRLSCLPCPPAPQVARLAAQAGRSIQDVVDWSRRAGGGARGGDYTVSAYHVQGRGRMQAVGAAVSARGAPQGCSTRGQRRRLCALGTARAPCFIKASTGGRCRTPPARPPADLGWAGLGWAEPGAPPPSRAWAQGDGGGLYGDLGSWADPNQIQAQLERAAQRPKRALTPAELSELRQRKAEAKRRKERAWLFT